MDSFEGSRRLDSRAPLSPAERRSAREGEPLEQRLDRWMSTGRQLVEGVSGGRPGSRPSGRRAEGRAGGRGGSGSLGRWVENRLDWLLDDSEDWPEPWQESSRRRREPPEPLERDSPPPEPLSRSARQAFPEEVGSPRASSSAAPASDGRQRRRLDAISRRVGAGRAAAPAQAAEAEDWPEDSSFSVPRWQRPSAPLRRADPLQTELEQRDPMPEQGGSAAVSRPLPRSSRRR